MAPDNLSCDGAETFCTRIWCNLGVKVFTCRGTRGIFPFSCQSDILNKPEMDTTSGRSIMMLVDKRVVLVLHQQGLFISPLRCLALVFTLLHRSLTTRPCLLKTLNNRRRKCAEMVSSSRTPGRSWQTVADKEPKETPVGILIVIKWFTTPNIAVHDTNFKA